MRCFSRASARLALVSCLCAPLILVGCADKRGGPIAYNVKTFGVPDVPTIASLGADYRIAPLDVLTIKVFKLPELSGDYDVDLTGQISMPLIGSVMAADGTAAQLDERLTQKLGERYLEHPDLSVGIKSSTRRSVTVDGAVNRAGTFPVNGPTTLMQAVALGGSTSPEANARRVAIFRQIDGKRQAAAFDLTAIRRGEMADPEIYAGDIIVVDGSSVKAFQKQILNSLPVLSVFKPF